ncbi:hypothetical protein J23TS9_34260 [Paenibacillus sp. J23TS9]|uniref:hypothetical protein n=1 Tax=Paenibacillus sp. J23TS9 TaxID=2807193 RepID=UPI001B237D44|nr:hypothetical protein [Paenibacillus sp. J23TS9]GIP28296.1 hypothetical protein J23TS9_34260 [Paenibacillus sp. J23TS9]
MKAPEQLLRVWHRFDGYPMETLTKAWYSLQPEKGGQRSVRVMKEHKEQYGITGNCFDLAIWLLDAFHTESIPAYAVGHDLGSPHAHVAVVALDEAGGRFFCDLGDQWIQPILVDRNHQCFTEEAVDGFITGGRIQVSNNSSAQNVGFSYVRPNGKMSTQSFDLTPISMEDLLAAANHSQHLLRHPLVEHRLYQPGEVVHWEFDRWTSFVSKNSGLEREDGLNTNEQWAHRISRISGIDYRVALQALDLYSELAAV